jgi:glycosyltransferase involved in cell wall biosynthesis
LTRRKAPEGCAPSQPGNDEAFPSGRNPGNDEALFARVCRRVPAGCLRQAVSLRSIPSSFAARKLIMNKGKKPKVTFVMTHPIQYYIGWCVALAQRPEIDFEVLYAYRQDQLFDRGFGKRYKWDIDLYSGYESETGPAITPLRAKVGWWALLFPKAIVRAFQRDVMILLGISNFTAMCIVITKRWHKARLVLRQDAANYGIRRSGVIGIVKRAAYRFLLRSIDFLLTQGQQNSNYFEFYGIPREKHLFAPVRVDETLFSLARRETRQKVRAAFGISDADFVFIVSGKLEARKRVNRILQAFAIHLSSGATTFLWIAGSGEREEYLKSLAKRLGVESRVCFHGFTLQQRIAELYGAADCLIHAACTDPWPIAILEGIRCGLPVILSSSVGSVGDIIIHGKTGFRFEENDTSELAEYMTRISKDRMLADSLARACREHLSDHTLETAASSVIDACCR